MSNELLTLSRVTAEDVSDVETVFSDLLAYSAAIGADGPPADAATEFAVARPPGVRMEDKHSFVASRDGCPVGLLDVVDGYPKSRTVFIGLLAIKESLHGAGLGHALYLQAEKFIRDDLAALCIRLAVVETNAVGGFWKRVGFMPTGELKPYERRLVVSRSILMEKPIRPSPLG